VLENVCRSRDLERINRKPQISGITKFPSPLGILASTNRYELWCKINPHVAFLDLGWKLGVCYPDATAHIQNSPL